MRKAKAMNNEMPDEIYVRTVHGKILSAVRPESPLVNSSVERPHIKYIRADKAVPEGWKLVPIEPVGAMIMYGIHAHERNDDIPHIGLGPKCVGIYKAMLSAAPQPPTKGED